MWSDPIVVRVGGRVVGVRTVPQQAGSLRSLLEPWRVDGQDGVPAAFDVLLDHLDAGSVRLVPQLRYGSCVIARGRSTEPIERALLQVLGDLAELERPDAVRLRLFVKGSRAVLTSLACPALVGDRALRAEGIREVACMQVTVDADAFVAIGPNLAGAQPVERWSLARVIDTEGVDDGDRGPSAAWTLSARGRSARWLHVLDQLGDRIARVTDTGDVRRLIVADLT